jgi:hypothetical protein
MKTDKQLLGYILRYFNGGYYVSHTKPSKHQTEIQHSSSLFEAHLFTDKQAVIELLEELEEFIDEKGYELLRLCKTKSRNNHILLPATDEDLEGFRSIDFYSFSE